MNVLGLKKDEIKNKKIISIQTYCNQIDLNIIENFTVVFVNLNEINPLNICVDKTESINDCIFSISFNQSLFLNIDVNHKLSQYNYDYFIAHSFSYNKNIKDINVYPISFNANIIDSIIYFYITYAITLYSKDDDNCITNEFFYNNKEENSLTQKRVFSDLSYIDINKEFI